MQVTTSVEIMQVLRLYCNYACAFSAIVMLVDLSVAIMHMTVSIGIIQLEVAALMQVTVSASNIYVKILILFTQVGLSVAIMQVVLFTVHSCFYYKMQVTDFVIAMFVTLLSNNFVFLSLIDTHFS